MLRKKLAIGNWKMHKTAQEAEHYVRALQGLISSDSGPFLAVPFTAIQGAAQAANGSKIRIGAQNMHEAKEGAFTGEISAEMLKASGASFVLLGHSERRNLFGETDEKVHQKLVRALQVGLIPVVCVGEKLEERQHGKTEAVLRRQIEAALLGVDPEKIVLAYEPVWAIGTGKSASAEMAQDTHAFCRTIVGAKTPILYGGSVQIDNVSSFCSQTDIDGVLVGGASLHPENFAQIAKKVLS